MNRQHVWVALALIATAAGQTTAGTADQDGLVVTAQGFDRPGVAKTVSGDTFGRLKITVRDRATGQLTACRVNVVGADGNFYQPAANRHSAYSLAGQWPESGKGNRQGKGPFRYLGRFFYTTGETEVAVPAGPVRIEVSKGFTYPNLAQSVMAVAGETVGVALELERDVSMTKLGYHSGDPHLHFARKDATDDETIFDLLDAEEIEFGSILAYNEPPGPYTGLMATMASPQLLGLGASSVKRRDETLDRLGTGIPKLNLWPPELVLEQ